MFKESKEELAMRKDNQINLCVSVEFHTIIVTFWTFIMIKDIHNDKHNAKDNFRIAIYKRY